MAEDAAIGVDPHQTHQTHIDPATGHHYTLNTRTNSTHWLLYHDNGELIREDTPSALSTFTLGGDRCLKKSHEFIHPTVMDVDHARGTNVVFVRMFSEPETIVMQKSYY